ncbi:DUF2953 domain-containing protein [Ferdinandcohnia sp. Marseille-Q9671]
MKWLLYLFLFLLFIIFLILLIAITKLTVYVQANHSQNNNQIKIRFSIWFGLIRYTITIPNGKDDKDTSDIERKKETQTDRISKKKEKKKKHPIKDFLAYAHDSKVILNRVVDLIPIIKDFLKKVTITKFEWHSQIGTGDAAQTGIVTGVGWSIKGTIVGVISHYLNLKVHPDYSITPYFQHTVSETKLGCMFHFRIGQAMVAGIRLVKKWRGGLPKFKSPTLSKLNETDSDKKSV